MAYDPRLAAALSGSKMELSLVDRSGKVQNFYAMYEDLVERMQDAMLESALETQARAYELCPVDTGFMRDHIDVYTSESMQEFEIGWKAGDFFEAGLPFYPMYVVLGTRYLSPRDPLTPAYAATKPVYEQRVAEAVREALQRRRMG
jgi:hypothetical protein